jgi:hypothetical protein
MTEHLITFLFACVFIFIIYRWRFFKVPEIPCWYFAAVFLLKFMAGVTLAFLFIKYFNGGDTYSYFENACRVHALALSHPKHFLMVMAGSDAPELTPFYDSLGLWKSYELFDFDAQTIIRINALIRFVSFGIYNVHVLFFSFFSLTGIMAFYRIMRRPAWRNHQLLFAGLFLFPSLMFWSSGILKEGILIFGMGLFFYGLHLLFRFPNRFRHSVWILFFALLLMMMVKMYVLALLIPGIAAWVWVEKTSPKNTWFKFTACHAVYFLLLFNLHYLFPGLNPVEVLYYKQHNSIVFADYMQSRSIIHPPVIDLSAASIVLNTPAAFWSTLIHPLIGDAHNPFALLSAIENVLMSGCMLMALLFSRQVKSSHLPLFVLSVFFAVMLYVLIGFTAATAGSLVRFKVPALPFIIFILTLLFDKGKIPFAKSRKTSKPG